MGLALAPPLLAAPIELRCTLNPDQFDTQEPLSEHLYTLNQDDSTLTFRTNASETSETHTAFY